MNALKRNPDDPLTALESEMADRIVKLEGQVAELVDGIRDGRDQIIYLHAKFRQTGSGNQVLARLQSLLAKHQ